MPLAPFAALEARIAAATSSRLANVVVTPAGGEPFGAELNRADALAFDAVVASTEVLVYLSSHGLADGDEIDISGTAYRVASIPQRKDANFSTADVVRA